MRLVEYSCAIESCTVHLQTGGNTMRTKEARDNQRSKVYAAEDVCFRWRYPETEMRTMTDVKAYSHRITSSRYWSIKGKRKRIAFKDGRGCSRATAGSKGLHRERDTITLPVAMRIRWVVIHEHAHILTNQTDFNTAAHGAVFCTHYINLVLELMGIDDAVRLMESLDAKGARYFKDKINGM
jgi:putative metallohydrolase (TIGR04338 family)